MDKRKTYIYKTAKTKEFRSLACGCHMHHNEHNKRNELWFLTPPDRGHMIPGEIVDETESGFAFRSDGYEPGIWQFKVLTIEDFRRKCYKYIVGGEEIARAIKTTDDLHEWYRTNFDF